MFEHIHPKDFGIERSLKWFTDGWNLNVDTICCVKKAYLEHQMTDTIKWENDGIMREWAILSLISNLVWAIKDLWFIGKIVHAVSPVLSPVMYEAPWRIHTHRAAICWTGAAFII